MESSAVDNESVSTPVDESTENKEKKKERERQRKERRERKFREWIFIGRKDERGGVWWKRPQICATTARRNNKFRVLLDISPCDMQKPWVISAVRESTFPPPSTYTPKWTQREDPSFLFPSKQFTRWLRASSRFRYTRNRRVIRFPRFFFRKNEGRGCSDPFTYLPGQRCFLLREFIEFIGSRDPWSWSGETRGIVLLIRISVRIGIVKNLG